MVSLSLIITGASGADIAWLHAPMAHAISIGPNPIFHPKRWLRKHITLEIDQDRKASSKNAPFAYRGLEKAGILLALKFAPSAPESSVISLMKKARSEKLSKRKECLF